MSDDNLTLGTRELYGANHQRQFAPFDIDARKHTYIIGASGAGKSYLLEQLISQHLQNGDSFGLLDIHGDLAEVVISKIPKHRVRDVCYFNPADREHPISWNLLNAVHADDHANITEAIVASFQQLFGSGWGPRTEHITRNSVAALLPAQSTTLLCIPKLLTDERYRTGILRQVTDPVVQSFWQLEFEQWDPRRFRIEAIAPLQNKLGQLFHNPILRNILGQVTNKIPQRKVLYRAS